MRKGVLALAKSLFQEVKIMTGYIYVITNDINGKQYVGKTTDTLKNRFEDHCKPYMLKHKTGRPLYTAMSKYGIEHFSIQLLGEYPEEQLAEQEQNWIKKLDTYYNGYNATLGGEGTQKYNYDIFIQEFDNGLNITEIAEKYECSTDTVSKALHNANRDTRRAAKEMEHKNKKSILQYTMNGEFIQEFPSQWSAAKWILDNHYTNSTNQNQIYNNISNAARQIGYRKSAYKFKWKIKEQDNSEA